MSDESHQRFEEMLTGGHPNSLGRTVEVVEIVLAQPSRLSELYECYFSSDEVVRLRTSSALKRIGAEQPAWLLPYVDGLLDDVSKINQPSAQWTLAELMARLHGSLTEQQKQKAVTVLQGNLESSSDWIVLNRTMQTLGEWALDNQALRSWLEPHLLRLSQDGRKSVARNAQKLRTELTSR